MKYKHVEFLIGTGIFLLSFFAAFHWGTNYYGRLVTSQRDGAVAYFWSVYPHFLMVLATYAGFLALNFYVVPKFWLTKRFVEATGLTLGVLTVAGLVFTVTFSYLRSWEYNQESLFQANIDFFSRGFIIAIAFLFVYGLYVTARELILYQYRLARAKQNLWSRIAREIILVISLWLAVLLPCLIFKGRYLVPFFGALYFFIFPYCVILYFLNLYWLIPRYFNESTPNGIKYIFNITVTAMAAGLVEVAFLFQIRMYGFTHIMALYWFLPTLVSVAVSWWVYLNNAETYKQLTTLQTKLGTTNANLQYLRSQINPHFLFNALNTLYGTALVEKAEKTGEGIQKLGDMMRFMLHENNQDRIALSRELEYIHNYIDLQTMRLALSPDVTVEIQIENIIGYAEIAPMLLIPFIENAYKHGISFQERSWININLYKQENQLHLDVHNSVHPVNLNDPERFQSGTGLDNVKQRLQLLYPGKHELVVRQNTKEFFVHLTLTLGNLNG